MGRMLDGLGALLMGMFVLCCIFVPLGVWKLLEIIVSLFQHVHAGVR